MGPVPAGSAAAAPPHGEEPLAQRYAALRGALPPRARLLAVSKGQPAEAIRKLVALGQRSFAESRLQEAAAKQEALADLEPLDWHFIGRLQANKARAVVRRFSTIHSVDGLALAQRLQRIAGEEQRCPAVLLQVKLRPDPGKTGFTPEALQNCWPQLLVLAPLRLVGLMTIAPQGLDAAGRSRLFEECAALARSLGLVELSMGMSSDWPEAAAAGATWLRIGSGLFGPRPDPSTNGMQDLAAADVGRY
ncbi:MAG: YggS family pyridoxal phosphate-dependent enzyme [Synechococcaceae cyanobacterium]|nr:YggS family pyridoxal phosphate-dependent enzyme [Synechococcaceae cyanobacterium]